MGDSNVIMTDRDGLPLSCENCVHWDLECGWEKLST